MAHSPSILAPALALGLLTGCYQGVSAQQGDPGAEGSSAAAGESGTSGGEDSDSGGEQAPAEVVPEPLHRLNRLEYNNTVRDLLGTSLAPADSFPPDNVTHGFDNVAEGLTLTPAQMDLYATAARQLATAALEIAPRYAVRIGARGHATATGQPGNAFDWGWSMPRQGQGLGFTVEPPQDEVVTFSILAGGDAFGMPTPEMGLLVDGVEVGHWLVTSTPTAPVVYSVALPLLAGTHALTITFPNGADQPAENVFNSLVVGYLDLTSEATVPPAGRARIYVCEPGAVANPEACYQSIVTQFAARAWRRPLTAAEADGVLALFNQLRASEGDHAAVSLVVRAMLMSAKFLYRPSLPAEGASASAGLVPLDDHALASRLSYFLWSSMPDDALFAAAASGALRTSEGLQQEVRRMLADPKADGLRRGFASQWLATRTLAAHAPDPATYPLFDEPLRAAMIAEAELFFGDFVTNGRPLGDMMDPDFGFLNNRLALHYGLPAPGSPELTRVELGEDSRRGLVMQGAWLTAMSASNRSSPVNRGRWILEQLLCITIPPPPPDIPPLMPPAEGQTAREMLAKHREDPICAGCHDLIDPAGLGMEEYDGIGAWRALENGLPVDVSGALPGAVPGAEPFDGAAELASLLADDPRFTECLAEKLFSYALGRQKAYKDAPFRAEINARMADDHGTLDRLIELIALSPAFRMRPEKAD